MWDELERGNAALHSKKKKTSHILIEGEAGEYIEEMLFMYGEAAKLCVLRHIPSGVEPGLWEPIELPLLFLLLSLLTDRLERSFLCTRCETGNECFLGSEAGGSVTPRGVLCPLLSAVCRPFCCLAESPSLACCRDAVSWGRG